MEDNRNNFENNRACVSSNVKINAKCWVDKAVQSLSEISAESGCLLMHNEATKDSYLI